MKQLITKDTTSKTMLIFVPDSSSTTGAGLTGLAWNTASLTWYYYREGAGTGATQVTLASMTIGTWASSGFVELDATNMPGWYEIGVPNAVLATGAGYAGMMLKGAANMAPVNIEIQLTDFDLGSATVTTDSASRTASKADVSALATTVELNKVPKSDGTTSWNATALAAINAEADTALVDYDPPTKAEMDTAHGLLATEAKQDIIDTNVDAILVDTSTTLPSEHALLATEAKQDIIDTNVDAILVDTGTDGVVLADDAIKASKYDESTAFPLKSADTGSTEVARTGADSDTLETLSDQIDGISAAQDRSLLVDTTIATLASQTSFTLTAGSADDDAYNQCRAVFEDAVTSEQKAVGLIADYTGATKTVTMQADPGIFTISVGDKIYIMAASIPLNVDINQEVIKVCDT